MDALLVETMFMFLYLWLTNHSTELGKLRREIEAIHKTLDKDEEDRED